MTIWKMLTVVCHRSKESQLTKSQTNDECLKSFDFIYLFNLTEKRESPQEADHSNYGMIILSVGSILLKAVNNYDN